VEHHDDVLLGWVSGDVAALTETLTDEHIRLVCWKILEWFMGMQVSEPIQLIR